jgi:hypothetical protein
MISRKWVARIGTGVAMVFVVMTNGIRAADALRQPESVVRTAFEYDTYLDAAPSSKQQAAATVSDVQNAQDSGTEGGLPKVIDVTTEGPAPASPAPPQPWRLPQPCWLQQHKIVMGGWVEQGITFNNLNPDDRFNGPVTTNDRNSEYQLNQAWLYFDRPTNTNGCGWDLGGHIDVMYGTDWRFGQCFGLENRIDSPNSFYGLILPQFYAEVAVNNLKVKLGHFATNTSLEKVPAVANFFYSHSYLMAGYFDPLLVTGLECDYKLGDNWTLVGGMNRGGLEFEDPNNTWDFLGGLRWTSDDKRQNLSLLVDTGDQVGFTGLHQRNQVFVVYTNDLTKKIQYGAQYNIGQETNGSFVTPGQNANWYGTEQLLTYKLNQKWSAGLRYEWVRDEEGSRIAGIGNLLGTDRGWRGLPGFTGSFQDVSLGLNYRPGLNWVVRPEVRWDMYDGPANPFGNFDRSAQFTFACDLIVTF